jgi:type VII secretion-associated serine protease mycosin
MLVVAACAALSVPSAAAVGPAGTEEASQRAADGPAPGPATIKGWTGDGGPSGSRRAVTLKRMGDRRPAKDPAESAHDRASVLVRFKTASSTAARAGALNRVGASGSTAVPGTEFVKVDIDGSARQLVRALAKDPTIAEVSLDYQRRLFVEPNDLAYVQGFQDYLATVRLPPAWSRIRAATSQVIAVVDTGVDVTHPDLAGRSVPGYNALTGGSSVTDPDGHGTMMAGIAAANTDNVEGVAGAAWTGRIMPVKVFPAGGLALDSDIAEGIAWAADHGAKVINLSLGGPEDSPVLHNAIIYATGKGALVVAAAGNDGDSTPQYPAAYSEVVAVGATDGNGALTDFSSWGDWIDVAAPGFDIASTYPGGDYAIGAGTSFAAPIVAGVAALIRAQTPAMTPQQVWHRIRATARDAGPRGIDPYYGTGLLDAFQAVGGSWGSELPQRVMGTGEPNDAPTRATPVSTSATGTMAMEGDVDWYRYEATQPVEATVRVTPAAYNGALAQNFDPKLAVW